MRSLVVLPPIVLSLLLAVSAVGCVQNGSSEIDRGNTTDTNVASPNVTINTTLPAPYIPGLRNLSDAEKEKVIQIALNTSVVSTQLRQNVQYTVTLDWVGIEWVAPDTYRKWEFEYDALAKGIPPEIPELAVVYSLVKF